MSAETPETRAQFAEIAHKAVRHIHRRRGMSLQSIGQANARLRQRDSGRADDRVVTASSSNCPAASASCEAQAERGIADRAGDDDPVALLWRRCA